MQNKQKRRGNAISGIIYSHDLDLDVCKGKTCENK